jgi:hypothetical protein
MGTWVLINARWYYTSKSNPPTMAVGGQPAAGPPFGAQAWTGTSDFVMGGNKGTNNFSCISMTQPANSQIFNAHMMCNISDASGTYTSAWGCSGQQATGMACVGRLMGQTGAYAGRMGTISGSGKGMAQTGAGQWDQ